MKKLLLAAFTAGALSLAFVPVSSEAAQLKVGVGPNGVAIKAGQMHHPHYGWKKGPRCKMVKIKHHRHWHWVKKCW